jgi:hypothetical protein
MSSRTLHSLELEFYRVTDTQTQDLYTHIAQLELELNHGLTVFQTSQNTLEFETAEARTFAQLVLARFSQFTARVEN